MWLKELKIAVIEKNPDSLSRLINDIPKLSDSKDIEMAIYLLKEATELMTTLKDETLVSMKKIKKNLDFLNSTHSKVKNKLDIKS